MPKSRFHYILFPKFIEHFILAVNCFILAVFASLLMFVIFLPGVRFLIEIVGFHSQQNSSSLLLGKALSQPHYNPSGGG